MTGQLLKIFHQDLLIENKLPSNFRESDQKLFRNDLRVRLPQSGLYLLKNVVVTDLGIIYQNFRPLKENIICYDADFKKYQTRYLLKSLVKFSRHRYKGKRCLIIFDNYSGPNGFAHWICDGLTRLAEMNDSLGGYTLIAPYYFKEQALYAQTLSFFNVGDIHYLPQNSRTYFDELHFPMAIGDTGNFHPANVAKLKQIFQQRIAIPAGGKKRNIYISRQKAKRRHVENEQEITAILPKYQFETVYLEEHSFDEQARIICSAANIVSIHGAALSMLLFAPEGASVLELRNCSDDINNMYFQLSNACGLNYYYLNCRGSERSKTANDFDLLVDLAEFENTVKQMISNN